MPDSASFVMPDGPQPIHPCPSAPQLDTAFSPVHSQQLSAMTDKIISQLQKERVCSQSFLREEIKKVLNMQEQIQASQKQERSKFTKLSEESWKNEQKELKETEKVLKEAQKELKETMLHEFETHRKEIQDSLKIARSSLVEDMKKVFIYRDDAISGLESNLGIKMKEIQNFHQKYIDEWGKNISSEVQVMAHEVRSMPNAVKSFDGRLESGWRDVEAKMTALKDHIVRLDEEIGNNVDGNAQKLGSQMEKTMQDHIGKLDQEIEKQREKMTGQFSKLVHQMQFVERIFTEPITQTQEISRELSSRSSKMKEIMDEIFAHFKDMSQVQAKIKSLEDTYQKDLLQSLLDLEGAQNNCKKSVDDITKKNESFAVEIAKRNERLAEQAQELMNSRQKEIVKSLSAAATNCEEIAGNARDEMIKLKTAVQTSVDTTIDKLNSVQANVLEKVNALAEKSSQHTSRLEKKADDAVKELDVRSKQIGASLDQGFANANTKLLSIVEEYRKAVHPEVERATNALHNLVHGEEMKRAKNELRDSVSHCKEEIDKTKNNLRDSVSHCKEEIDKLKPDREALQEIRKLAAGLTQTIDSVQPLLNQVRGGGALGFVATLGAVIPLFFK